MATASEHGLAAADFERLQVLIRRRAGIVVDQTKRPLVLARLGPEVNRRFDGDFRRYCDRLAQGDERELERFVHLLTTHHTSFFREPHHFEHLARLAPAVARRRHPGPLRVWSAASSTGEEAYSAAITLAEALDGTTCVPPQLLGTDISVPVVERASVGIYAVTALGHVPEVRVNRWFLRGTGSNTGMLRAKAVLRRQVSFGVLNLLAPWPLAHDFDFVFCRNVLIYFDEETRVRVVSRIVGQLRPGGVLFLGHSEGGLGRVPELRQIGPSTFEKVAE